MENHMIYDYIWCHGSSQILRDLKKSAHTAAAADYRHLIMGKAFWLMQRSKNIIIFTRLNIRPSLF